MKRINLIITGMLLTLSISTNVYANGNLPPKQAIGNIHKIMSIINNLKNKDNQKENILKEKIIFKNDIKLFTLYSFMNYTGYDDENNRNGFSEVRKSVRKDLNQMNLNLSDNNYYTNKLKLGVNYYDYRNVLNYINKDFNLIESLPSRYSNLNDLPEQLKEFYREANIEKLYNKYKTQYDIELNKYKDGVFSNIEYMNKFLKFDFNNVEPFYIQVNLLDAYERGYGLGNVSLDTKKGSIITGPSEKPNLLNINHEYLHGIINPITNNLQSEIQLSSSKIELIPKNTQAKGYNNWESIINESIIRALEYRGNDVDRDLYINSVVDRNGFIPAKYFDKRFDEFKNYDGTLEEFIKKIIIEYANYKD